MDVGEAAEQQAADSTSDSEGGPSDDVHGSADPQAPTAGLSKNAQKKLRKQAEWELKKAQRKVEGKARRRADRARWVAEKEQVRCSTPACGCDWQLTPRAPTRSCWAP